LDLSHNAIADPAIVDVLAAAVPALRVLYLTGNPCVAAVPHYRRTMVCRLRSLTFLDDMPVFEKERRLAEAWMRGGHEAEHRERAAMAEEQRERDRRNFEALDQLMGSSRSRTDDEKPGDLIVYDLEKDDAGDDQPDKGIVVPETLGPSKDFDDID
jgi:dynein assembly factor 1